jgi:protein-S-isoprenylcysteine O-methyltransferase Ste14
MKTKKGAALGTLVFFFVAPMTVAVWVPYLLTHWESGAEFFGPFVHREIGVALILLGASGLIESFVRFVMKGRGTPAPIAPPETLVVTGLYRFVRNPMYVSILAMLIGESLWLARVELAIYAGVVFAVTALWVGIYEEPTLRRKFGASYATYCANVPRFLPRLTPWQPTS